jgi:hypothetical protein
MILHSPRLLLLLLVLLVKEKECDGRYPIRSPTATNTKISLWRPKLLILSKVASPSPHHSTNLQVHLTLQQVRGGGIQVNEEEEEEEYEEEEYEKYEEEVEEEKEEDQTHSSSTDATTKDVNRNGESDSLTYDEPWVINPINSFMVQLAVIMMCRKVDMKEFRIVHLAR